MITEHLLREYLSQLVNSKENQDTTVTDAVASFLKGKTAPDTNAAPADAQPLSEEMQSVLSTIPSYNPPKVEATGRRFAPEGQSMPEVMADQPPAPEARKSTGRQRAQSDFIQASNTQQRPKTHRELMAEMAPGDAHEYKRNLIMQEKRNREAFALKVAGSMYTPGSEEFKRVVDSYKPQVDNFYAPEELKPFEDTQEFKNVEQQFNNEQYRKSINTLATFRGELEYARSIQDKTERANFIMAQMPKMLNTLAAGSSDAVGIQEFTRLMPELSTIWNSPISEWPSLLQTRGLDILSQDPDKFLKKATELYNIGAKVHDDRAMAASSVVGKSLYKTGAFSLAPLKNIEPGNESPAQMQALREGRFKPTPAFQPVNQYDPRKFSTPVVSTFNGAPLSTGTISGKGVRLFGTSKVDPNELPNKTSF